MKKFEMPDFYFTGSITDEQLKFFNQYGIIQFKNFIDKTTVSQFLGEVKLVQNELLKSETKKVNGIPLKFGTDVDGSKLIQRIAFTSFYSKKLSAFLKGEKLAKLLNLMGPYDGRIGENEKDGLVFNHYVNSAESRFTQLGWHTNITGSYHPKNETSATPFYHKLAQIKDQRLAGKLSWAGRDK